MGPKMVNLKEMGRNNQIENHCSISYIFFHTSYICFTWPEMTGTVDNFLKSKHRLHAGFTTALV